MGTARQHRDLLAGERKCAGVPPAYAPRAEYRDAEWCLMSLYHGALTCHVAVGFRRLLSGEQRLHADVINGKRSCVNGCARLSDDSRRDSDWHRVFHEFSTLVDDALFL
jgi:hypothetical protein